MIPLLPLHQLYNTNTEEGDDVARNREQDILYLVKMIRLKRGLENFAEMNDQIKTTFTHLMTSRSN